MMDVASSRRTGVSDAVFDWDRLTRRGFRSCADPLDHCMDVASSGRTNVSDAVFVGTDSPDAASGQVHDLWTVGSDSMDVASSKRTRVSEASLGPTH